jgi:glutamine amidotransferase
MSASTPEVLVVDYGMGNLFSVDRAVGRAGGKAVFTDDPGALASAERIILPGVGAFGDGMTNLIERGFDEALRQTAEAGIPMLGICLGMQLMLSVGEEFGVRLGLGLVPGRVVAFAEPEPDGPRFKIPHVGWSSIVPRESEIRCEPADSTPAPEWSGTILAGLPADSFAYFVHSFVAVPESPEHILAETSYGGQRFCSAVRSGSMYGCQFHPELSAQTGLTIMANFLAAERD